MQSPSAPKRWPSRSASAMLAIGGYVTGLGTVFMSPFLVSARAQQNDVFMTNLFFGPPIFLVGSTVLIIGFHELGLRRSLVSALAVGNPLVVWLISWLASNTGFDGIRAIAASILADTCFLIMGSMLLAGMHHRWGTWGRAALLAASGIAVVTFGYILFGSRYYAFGETASSLPPYLDGKVIGLSMAVGLVILVAALRWGQAR